MTGDPGPPVLAAGDPAALEAAVLALQAGEVVGLPTETVYGIGVLPQPRPLQSLIEAKHRPLDKGIALLIDDLAQVDALVMIPPVAHALAQAFWPGALTLVLPLRVGATVPAAVTGGRGTLGLRIPDHGVPRALVRALGRIAVSSANRSGEPEATTAAELVASVGATLALVLDDGPVRGGTASSVIAVDTVGTLTILRVGAINSAAIEHVAAGSS